MKKILLVALLAIIITSAPLVYSSVLLDRIVATVNDEVITWSELMNVIIIDGKEHLVGASGEEREKKIRELERPFLNNLIEMKLQLQVAQRMDLTVDDSEVEGAILEIRNKYGLSEESLMDSLRAEGLNPEDYRKRMADQILLQKVINFSVRSNVVVSDKDIEQYYKENRQHYGDEDKIRISQIFFISPGDDSQKILLENRARELAGRINSGDDFAELAREYSEDPSSEFGGDLGYISRGTALSEIEDAAASLQVGEVSSPFWSPAGLHIIKVEDRMEGGGLDKYRESIKAVLFQKEFEKIYSAWIAGLKERAYIEIKL